VREEKSTDAVNTVASAAVNTTSTASVNNFDAPMGAKNNNSDDQGPNQEAGGEDDGRDDVGEP
jgi:hypothetical protein